VFRARSGVQGVTCSARQQYTQTDETGFKSLAEAVFSKGRRASKQAKQASGFSFLFFCRSRYFKQATRPRWMIR